MHYQFPADLSLDEVRSVIAKRNAHHGTNVFDETNKGDYTVFNYAVQFDGLFPTPDTGDPALDREYAVLRECRSLIFSPDTGKILARKCHKFFSVNQNAETQIGQIDFTRPHVILEKLDGSLLTPISPRFERSDIRWTSKRGETPICGPVVDFVSQCQEYNDLSWAIIGMDATPMFEWCSRKQPIVLDYPEDRLVLLAIRFNETGHYMPYPAMVKLVERYWPSIEVVRAIPNEGKTAQQILDEVRAWRGAEGIIFRFDDGHMLKAKGEWYLRIHNTIDALRFEKDVWALLLNDQMDDVKPFMTAATRARVEEYEAKFFAAIGKTAAEMAAIVAEAKARLGDDRKAFAAEILPNHTPWYAGPIFAIWQGRDPAAAVRRVLAENVFSTTKVDRVRDLVGGLRWETNDEDGSPSID